jgi:hypothetical protein
VVFKLQCFSRRKNFKIICYQILNICVDSFLKFFRLRMPESHCKALSLTCPKERQPLHHLQSQRWPWAKPGISPGLIKTAPTFRLLSLSLFLTYFLYSETSLRNRGFWLTLKYFQICYIIEWNGRIGDNFCWKAWSPSSLDFCWELSILLGESRRTKRGLVRNVSESIDWWNWILVREIPFQMSFNINKSS